MKLKKLRNIYSEICSFDNLYAAYLSARKGKRFRQDVLRFTANLEENLISLQNQLIWRTYRVGRYREFYVTEPKKRLIMALQFKDRVVQWAIYRHLNPFLDRQFIYDSYGCRDGKGTHNAANRLQYWLRQVDRRDCRYYYLKLDISKYFYRVDHEVLIDILRRKVDDDGLMWLLTTIVNSEDMAFGLPLGADPANCPKEDRLYDKGMPIGNLTSQMFANLYLNELDQYIKHVLRVRYYIRYMDDMIILHDDKSYLHEIKDLVETFLTEKLRLSLNKKTALRPIETGVEFVGFMLWPTHRKLKKSTSKRMRSRLRYLQKAYARGEASIGDVSASVQSYLGLLEHCDGYRLRKSVIGGIRLTKKR